MVYSLWPKSVQTRVKHGLRRQAAEHDLNLQYNNGQFIHTSDPDAIVGTLFFYTDHAVQCQHPVHHIPITHTAIKQHQGTVERDLVPGAVLVQGYVGLKPRYSGLWWVTLDVWHWNDDRVARRYADLKRLVGISKLPKIWNTSTTVYELIYFT